MENEQKGENTIVISFKSNKVANNSVKSIMNNMELNGFTSYNRITCTGIINNITKLI